MLIIKNTEHRPHLCGLLDEEEKQKSTVHQGSHISRADPDQLKMCSCKFLTVFEEQIWEQSLIII